MHFHIKDVYKNPEYIKLSRSRKKRVWALIDQKTPPEEALNIAKHEMPVVLTREGLVENVKTPNFIITEKTDGIRESSLTKTNNNGMKQSEYVPPVKPAISKVEIHNTNAMSKEEMEIVHNALLLEILKLEKGTGPRFTAIFYMPAGWILIYCENHFSQTWLSSIIQEMKPWPEANLSIKSRSQSTIVTTFLPTSEADTVDKAILLIGKQNKGLNIEEWKILHEKEYEGGKGVTLSLDIFSVEMLQKSNFIAMLGFKKIYFKVQDSVPPEEMTNASISPEVSSLHTDHNNGQKDQVETSEDVQLQDNLNNTDPSNGVMDIGSKELQEQDNQPSETISTVET